MMIRVPWSGYLPPQKVLDFGLDLACNYLGNKRDDHQRQPWVFTVDFLEGPWFVRRSKDDGITWNQYLPVLSGRKTRSSLMRIPLQKGFKFQHVEWPFFLEWHTRSINIQIYYKFIWFWYERIDFISTSSIRESSDWLFVHTITRWFKTPTEMKGANAYWLLVNQ